MPNNVFITYQLSITLNECSHLLIGKLGIYEFPAGRYVYTGSAKNNIEARIARHLRHDKKIKWHIDYLLASPHAQVDGVLRFTIPECKLNQAMHGLILVAGFGSSDCHAGCGSHLKYIGG